MLQIYNATGTTLLEILISLVILSVGILGLLELQANNLQQINATYYLSSAVNQASNASELIKSCVIAGPKKSVCVHAAQSQWQDQITFLLPEAKSSWQLDNGFYSINLAWKSSDKCSSMSSVSLKAVNF